MFRFLIVDDNEADAVTLSFLVEERYGKVAHCECAGTLAGALEWLDERRHETFDAMLLDLNLPDARGLETFRAIQSAVRGRIPIVVNTGRDDERGLRDQLIAEGASDYLPKGQVDVEQVFETLRDAAQRARFCARLNPQEVAAIEASKRKTTALVQHARNSEPPGCGPSRDLLLAETLDSQGELLRDVVQAVAVMRERQERVVGRVGATEERLDETADATQTLKTKALVLEGETGKLRDLNTANKRKLGVLAAAVLALGWTIGNGTGETLALLLKLFGLGAIW